jgi:hypothetical protein
VQQAKQVVGATMVSNAGRSLRALLHYGALQGSTDHTLMFRVGVSRLTYCALHLKLLRARKGGQNIRDSLTNAGHGRVHVEAC